VPKIRDGRVVICGVHVRCCICLEGKSHVENCMIWEGAVMMRKACIGMLREERIGANYCILGLTIKQYNTLQSKHCTSNNQRTPTDQTLTDTPPQSIPSNVTTNPSQPPKLYPSNPRTITQSPVYFACPYTPWPCIYIPGVCGCISYPFSMPIFVIPTCIPGFTSKLSSGFAYA